MRFFSRSRADRRRQLVLHIGSGKTGTSSLQSFLALNRQPLADAGWLYPQSPENRRHRHARLGFFVQPDHQLLANPVWLAYGQSPEEFRHALHQGLQAEVEGADLPGIVLSDEALYGAPEESLRRFRSFTDDLATRTRVLVYLRRQDDHLISRYQQVVKVGETRRLADRTGEVDFSSTYDYRSRLDLWRRVMEPSDFVVRRFETESFTDGSLYQDFLTAAGIDLEARDLPDVERQNESLDAEAVELLRLLNIVRVQHEGATSGRINNRRFVIKLAADSSGPVLTLPEPVLDAFMARWAASNAAVAKEFLDEPDGVLFRTPRRTRNTTTEQVLDPARVDHYIDLLELPDEWHDPLRAVAEREARSRHGLA